MFPCSFYQKISLLQRFYHLSFLLEYRQAFDVVVVPLVVFLWYLFFPYPPFFVSIYHSCSVNQPKMRLSKTPQKLDTVHDLVLFD